MSLSLCCRSLLLRVDEAVVSRECVGHGINGHTFTLSASVGSTQCIRLMIT